MGEPVPPVSFSQAMSSFFKSVIPGFLSLVLACSASANGAEPGFLEGHLKIYSPKQVDLADGKASPKTSEDYARYPLIVLGRDGKEEIARVTANADGDYRTALPPGDYVLDVQGRGRGHLRAKPQPFRVISERTSRVDMEIDTGVR